MKSGCKRLFISAVNCSVWLIPIWLVCLVLAESSDVLAQSRSATLGIEADPRGKVDLTVCSQNLYNYGALADVQSRLPKATAEQLERQEQALVRRFSTVGCDLIAVQEVLGRTSEDSQKALDRLATLLRRRTNRIFSTIVGESNDRIARIGFIVATDRAEILNSLSYARVELPKLIEGERPRMFARGPFEIQLRVRPLPGSYPKIITAVTFHFKSQRGAASDPAALEWETYRMQMAEALRRIVEDRHRHALESGESLLVLLGDRNANFDSASARILEGVLDLNSFKGDAVCRLSKRGVPLCRPESNKPQLFFSVITGDPDVRAGVGTFQYQRVYSWLDDILVPGETLPTAWRDYSSTGRYASGVVHEHQDASDHGLVYVRLNW